MQSPPAPLFAHPQRLLPSVTAPAGAGGYGWLVSDGGQPVRFDPCQPIHYVISGPARFGGATALLASAVSEVSRGTGMTLVYAGRTFEPPSQRREPYQPDRYG